MLICPFACFAASKRLIGSFSLSLYDSLQLPRFFVPFIVQVSEFDASHTFYFLVDQLVKVWVYRVLALVNHCYKIFDDSNSELTFEVGTYRVTWVEQVAFARPLSNGHRFRESKGGAQPFGFMSAVSAVDRVSVSPELLQPSYFYGPQVSHLFSSSLIYLLSFELVRFCPCICNLQFMSVSFSFGCSDFHLQTKILKMKHDLAFLGLLCTIYPFFIDLLKVLDRFPVNWSRFVPSMGWMLLYLWARVFSINEFVFTNLFGNFEQHDWCLTIVKNRV